MNEAPTPPTAASASRHARCRLERTDLPGMEALLIARMREFLTFTGHALYFPTRNAPAAPEHLPRERRLLLPLIREGETLGVLMLGGVQSREVRPLLRHLPAVASLCLEFLQQGKFSRTDRVTGLATEDVLYERMENDVARVRAQLSQNDMDGCAAPLHRMCMGLVLAHLENGRTEATETGFCFSDELMARTAEAFARDLPPDVCVARVGRFGIAALIPAVSGREDCRGLAEAALERISHVRLEHPLTGSMVRPRIGAGHAIYPQDMSGAELGLEFSEQARRLMERARLAARMAAARADRRGGAIMSFARILRDGGSITEILPRGRVRVNLGRRAKAHEGQLFSVMDEENRFRGEIVLLRTEEMESTAEILHLADATLPLEAGQRLVIPDRGAGVESDDSADGDAAVAADGDEIRGHADFLRLFARARERTERFALTLVRRETEGAADGRCLDPVIEAWRATPSLRGANVLAGRYGANGLFFFHPGADADSLVPLWADFCARLQADGVAVAAGVASHPFLQFRKADIPDCAVKALEYARLLPAPHVGPCNSLALTIGADRLYGLGDVLGAMEEYKLALLADADNALAWNSLGVCYAGTGRQNEARRYLLEALQRARDTEHAVQVRYNLGTVCLQMDEPQAAAEYFRQCLEDEPDHLFALLRLGQICEEAGRSGEARRHYERAAEVEDRMEKEGRPATGAARRALARLAAARRGSGEAREMLHEALLRNPSDAAAMLQLADLYLEGDEDPGVAEALARRSLALRDVSAAWTTLARALRIQGREDEARMAEGRALMA